MTNLLDVERDAQEEIIQTEVTCWVHTRIQNQVTGPQEV